MNHKGIRFKLEIAREGNGDWLYSIPVKASATEEVQYKVCKMKHFISKHQNNTLILQKEKKYCHYLQVISKLNLKESTQNLLELIRKFGKVVEQKINTLKLIFF